MVTDENPDWAVDDKATSGDMTASAILQSEAPEAKQAFLQITKAWENVIQNVELKRLAASFVRARVDTRPPVSG